MKRYSIVWDGLPRGGVSFNSSKIAAFFMRCRQADRDPFYKLTFNRGAH